MKKNQRDKEQKARSTKTNQTLCTQDIERSKKEETAQVFADIEQDEAENKEIAGEKQAKRNSRNRRAPDRYGLPVYICGVEKKTR